MRILFMGTPDFAVPSLRTLVEAGYKPIAVATAPDKPRGRGQVVRPCAVKAAALDLGINTILQPESVREPAFAEAVRALDLDLQVVVAFRILPKEVFEATRLGAFNLHGSLLPKYRGAAPIHRAVMAGETETGVTTFFLREKVDTGHVILKKAMPIGPDDTTGDVHDRMMTLGAEAVLETVRRIETGAAAPFAQNDELATPAPKVFRDEAGIPWLEPAGSVHNHIRGLSPVPGAWTLFRGQLLKVYRSRMAQGHGEAGSVLGCHDQLVVACGEGAVELVEVQPEGRRRMTAGAWVRGAAMDAGDRFDS